LCSREGSDSPSPCLRGEVAYWNFLPPEELDELLKLYSRVSHKTLRISKTFGIEGRKLLKPEDDYDDLKEFAEAYEGKVTPVEEMKLEFQKMLKDHPGLESRLNALPGRVFSGKEHPSPGTKAVFFCYARPAHDPEAGAEGEESWSVEAGDAQWYLYDLASEAVIEEPTEIVNLIRSTPETPRRRTIERATLSQVRRKVEKHIKDTYLKRINAPGWVRVVLRAWMELS
jgi:hypothetical protein